MNSLVFSNSGTLDKFEITMIDMGMKNFDHIFAWKHAMFPMCGVVLCVVWCCVVWCGGLETCYVSHVWCGVVWCVWCCVWCVVWCGVVWCGVM